MGTTSLVSGRLDALAGEEPVDGLAMDAENAADPDRVEPSVVNQPANRFRMDAELPSDLAHAVQGLRLGIHDLQA